MLALLSLFGFVYFSNGCELINHAVLVVNKEYRLDRLTAVVWWRSNEQTVTQFLEQYKGTVVTVNINSHINFDDTNFHDTISYRQTVFFANTPDEFEYFLKKINKTILISIHVIMLLTNDNTETVDTYTKIALENDIGDIIIIRNDAGGNIKLSTYKPYGNGYCLNYTAIDMSLDIKSNNTFFIRKYNNFYNCPIRVTAHEFMPYTIFTKNNGSLIELGGTDGYLLQLMLEKLNSSMDLVRFIDYGRPNHFIDMSLELIEEFKYSTADIMIPSLVWTSKRHSIALGSHTHWHVNIVWFLPIRREIYKWAKMLLPFYHISTLLLITVFLLMFLTIRIIVKFGKIHDESRNAISFKMLGIFLGQSMMRKNSRNCVINSLFMFWIWFCMLFETSYQGQLIDGLHKTILEPELRTLDEAVKAVEGLGGAMVLHEYYHNTTIESKYEVIKLMDISKYVKEIANGRRFLLMGDKFQIKVYGPVLTILEEGVITLPTSFHVRPRWPAAVEISSLISRILESGLFVKILNDHTFKALLKYNYENTNKQEDSFKAMDIETMKSLFQGLIAMIVISVLVFIVEIFWNEYETKKRVRRRILPRLHNK
ncbi:unnamed protein product [Euphydryas editha]|uniref:Uncharacterized protein n=1 Tax=Euphydryas editha TaxID=104508 RepID=A0AAU9UB10_EUPED|nr:unnamed protein product [Euphydryas editha]